MRGSKSVGYLAAVLLVVLAGCGDGQASADSLPTPGGTSGNAELAPDGSSALISDSAATTAEAPPSLAIPPAPLAKVPGQIRGLYLNAYAAGSRTRLPRLMAIADTTEINAFVIDVKTERGVHFTTE